MRARLQGVLLVAALVAVVSAHPGGTESDDTSDALLEAQQHTAGLSRSLRLLLGAEAQAQRPCDAHLSDTGASHGALAEALGRRRRLKHDGEDHGDDDRDDDSWSGADDKDDDHDDDDHGDNGHDDKSWPTPSPSSNAAFSPAPYNDDSGHDGKGYPKPSPSPYASSPAARKGGDDDKGYPKPSPSPDASSPAPHKGGGAGGYGAYGGYGGYGGYHGYGSRPTAPVHVYGSAPSPSYGGYHGWKPY